VIRLRPFNVASVVPVMLFSVNRLSTVSLIHILCVCLNRGVSSHRFVSQYVWVSKVVGECRASQIAVDRFV